MYFIFFSPFTPDDHIAYKHKKAMREWEKSYAYTYLLFCLRGESSICTNRRYDKKTKPLCAKVCF